jgi:glycine/D-amino acid oxidase-like deaminating enzyme
MQLWDDIAVSHPNVPYRRTGVLYLDDARFDLDAYYAQHTDWGYNLEWITANDVRQLEPNLRTIPERGLWARGEGAVEAGEAAQFFAAAARDRGAKILKQTSVGALACDGSRVTGVTTADATIGADVVVVAAGVETPAIAATAGVNVPLKSTPGLLIRTRPSHIKINRMILTRAVHFRQMANGSYQAGEDFGGGEINDDPELGSQQLIERIRQQLVDAQDIELAGYTVGNRPIPMDGFPIISRPATCDGLYIAVMHSGATLAPAVGKFATEEILTGERNPLLQPFGLDRFAAKT